MAQIRLMWDNAYVLNNPNVTTQRAGYRQKSVGGIFITTGFTPANDLPKSAVQADTPTLLDNVVYEFKVQAMCTQNGPSDNDNGVQELLVFQCMGATVSFTHNESTITIDLTNTDINKVKITLKKSSDNSVVAAPIDVDRVGNTVTRTVINLTPDTNYYWSFELMAIVDGVQIISSNVDQLGAPCPPSTFKTNQPPVCDPVVSLTATSIEIL